jgi:biopolymer transport protein ExbD
MPLRLSAPSDLSLGAALGMTNCATQTASKWSPFDRLRRRQLKRTEYFCTIDVTPIASVFVVLLFVMMNATPNHDLPGNSVDLARAKNSVLAPGALRKDALSVFVKRDGQIYFGYLRVGRDELPALIREGLRAGAEHRIYIFADARAKYDDVLATLEGARRANVECVTFITESPRR